MPIARPLLTALVALSAASVAAASITAASVGASPNVEAEASRRSPVVGPAASDLAASARGVPGPGTDSRVGATRAPGSGAPGRLSPVEVAPPASPGPTTRGRWDPPLRPLRVVGRFVGPPQPWAPGHRGADLLAAAGTPVLAPDDGVAAFAGMVAGRPVLSIDHPGGLRSTYEPVASRVAVGDRVARGQVIAVLVAGPSHCATTCLHWGARRGGTYVDPMTLIDRGPLVLLPLR